MTRKFFFIYAFTVEYYCNLPIHFFIAKKVIVFKFAKYFIKIH